MHEFFQKFSTIFELFISIVVITFSGGLITGGIASFFQRDISKNILRNEGYIVFGLMVLVIFLSGVFSVYKNLRSK